RERRQVKRHHASQVASLGVCKDLVEPTDLCSTGWNRIPVAKEIRPSVENHEPVASNVDEVPEAVRRQRLEPRQCLAIPPVVQIVVAGGEEHRCACSSEGFGIL